MWVIAAEQKWLNEHAEYVDGQWRCKTTGLAIMYRTVGRSIWMRPTQGGFGEVRPVAHLYCEGCNPNFSPPRMGEPIYEDELVETIEATTP